MKERPILFSGLMVRAILDGRKTVTRRVVKPQPRIGRYGPQHPTHPNGVIGRLPGTLGGGDYHVWRAKPDYDVPLLSESDWAIERHCPFGVPGDRLWVRETWQVFEHEDLSVDALTLRHVEGQLGGDVVFYADDPDEAVERWRPSIHMPRWASRITLEVVSVRVERLADISDADAKAEGYASASEFLGAPWAVSVGPNPWVWVVEFKRVEAAK